MYPRCTLTFDFPKNICYDERDFSVAFEMETAHWAL